MEKIDVSKTKKANGRASADPDRPGWLNIHGASGEHLLHCWHNSVARIVHQADRPGTVLVFATEAGGGWEHVTAPLPSVHSAILAAKKASEAAARKERARQAAAR